MKKRLCSLGAIALAAGTMFCSTAANAQPANNTCGANQASFTIPGGGGVVTGSMTGATRDGAVVQRRRPRSTRAPDSSYPIRRHPFCPIHPLPTEVTMMLKPNSDTARTLAVALPQGTGRGTAPFPGTTLRVTREERLKRTRTRP